jgi:hypothetical protein
MRGQCVSVRVGAYIIVVLCYCLIALSYVVRRPTQTRTRRKTLKPAAPVHGHTSEDFQKRSEIRLRQEFAAATRIWWG